MEKARIRWEAADSANCELTECEDCRTRQLREAVLQAMPVGSGRRHCRQCQWDQAGTGPDRWAARQVAGPKSMVRTFPSRLAYSL